MARKAWSGRESTSNSMTQSSAHSKRYSIYGITSLRGILYSLLFLQSKGVLDILSCSDVGEMVGKLAVCCCGTEDISNEVHTYRIPLLCPISPGHVILSLAV